MSSVKWIKIVTDIFDDEKILLIESLPGSDSIIVIWFKLLCLAGKNNNSGVFLLNDRIPYTEEMLATIFRKEVNTVRFALKTFSDFGMIELINNVITIPNWNKHQTLDAYEKKKERDRIYQKEKRAKQKLLIESSKKSSDKSNDNSSDTSSDVVALEEDKEKEEEREEDIDINIYSEIIDYLNSKANTNYRVNNKKTRASINARIAEGFTIDDFKKVIDIKSSEWLNTNMQQYLRPETLFGTKFEGYLNQKVTKQVGNYTSNNSKRHQENTSSSYNHNDIEAELLKFQEEL
ncbi:phage replisome organizer N-terminal domain-containing protein [Clostridium sp. NSJ-6]|uniref:Phage replisome organizer N-terminal domain-containing protein n=1 Tax=Clostridium hominis TaxID=2763036 RepID=A0ABR7DI45_9CLOT|nr:phage replisome organizer N-terminal domain-containing protein [Clostridium hominis]MBC5631033.1 phage replisome organizer N-terminal domain-containing protein [Clostridium hominis]